MSRFLAAIVAACALAAPHAAESAPVPSIVEYSIPTANSDPEAIVVGPDGNLWFTEFAGNKIGRITPLGTITEFALPTPDAGPHSITAGPDGNLWFTEYNANQIGKISTAGAITEYPIPTPMSHPLGITGASDGNVWFAESDPPFTPPSPIFNLGRITPAGAITEYRTNAGPTLFDPMQVAAAPNNVVWLATRSAGFFPYGTDGQARIGVAMNGAMGSKVYGLTLGGDGNMWGTVYSSNLGDGHIVTITQDGLIAFALARQFAWPYGIARGTNGNMWFTESNANQVATITPTGVVTEYAVPTPDAMPRGIATTSGGEIWFTEFGANKIGRLSFQAFAEQAVVPTLELRYLVLLGLALFAIGAWRASRTGPASPRKQRT